MERDIEAEFDAILPHLILLRNLEAPVVVYADTSRGRHDGIWQPISRRPRLPDDGWAEYGVKLTMLAEKMAEFGVAMAFHHHMGTVVETDREVDLLMAHTGEAVGLLFDTGHSAFSGGDPVALARRHGRRINHVHCKDTRAGVLEKARHEDMSFMGAVLEGLFTVPGDGSIDFVEIVRVLHEASYDGWLVVEAEQDPKKADPLTYAKLGYGNLLRLARDAGFEVAGSNPEP